MNSLGSNVGPATRGESRIMNMTTVKTWTAVSAVSVLGIGLLGGSAAAAAANMGLNDNLGFPGVSGESTKDTSQDVLPVSVVSLPSADSESPISESPASESPASTSPESNSAESNSPESVSPESNSPESVSPVSNSAESNSPESND